jgi:hypothetical protein
VPTFVSLLLSFVSQLPTTACLLPHSRSAANIRVPASNTFGRDADQPTCLQPQSPPVISPPLMWGSVLAGVVGGGQQRNQQESPHLDCITLYSLLARVPRKRWVGAGLNLFFTRELPPPLLRRPPASLDDKRPAKGDKRGQEADGDLSREKQCCRAETIRFGSGYSL